MKKFLSVYLPGVMLSIAPLCSSAQWNVVINFDGYNGTVASVPPFTYISWNSVSPASFYTSAGNFGAGAPSYKFGNDGDYIISKEIIFNDSISFWVKGNGSPFSELNELRIYHSDDSTNWILQTAIDSLPASGTTMTFPISHVSGQYKFEYYKVPSGGNLAIDDITLYSNAVIGQQELAGKEKIRVYPSPSSGMVYMEIINPTNPSVEVYDNSGKQVRCDVTEWNRNFLTLDLSRHQRGFYFIRIRNGSESVTKKISLDY